MLAKIIQRVIVATLVVFAMSFMTNPVVFADAKEDIAEYTERIKSNSNNARDYLSRGFNKAKELEYKS